MDARAPSGDPSPAQPPPRLLHRLRDALRARHLSEGRIEQYVHWARRYIHFQRRQERLTQGLLDLKRLYWNMHTFRQGKRKGESPYERLGLQLPPGDW